jgi:hypothetical protein
MAATVVMFSCVKPTGFSVCDCASTVIMRLHHQTSIPAPLPSSCGASTCFRLSRERQAGVVVLVQSILLA